MRPSTLVPVCGSEGDATKLLMPFAVQALQWGNRLKYASMIGLTWLAGITARDGLRSVRSSSPKLVIWFRSYSVGTVDCAAGSPITRRCCSKSEKKKVLSFLMGPPILPPKEFWRYSAFLTIPAVAKKSRALRTSFRKYSYREP